jgi:phospholipase/carboxylesterase
VCRARSRLGSFLLVCVLAAACTNASPPAPEPTREAVRTRDTQSAEARELNVRWFGTARADAPVVIVLHGFGVAGDDLVPLAQLLAQHTDYRYAVPEAPIALPREGRAWWAVDFSDGRSHYAQGGLDLRKEAPPELPRARALIAQLIQSAKQRTGVSENKIALVGFSQGAMLSLDTALHLATPPACVGFLSGSYLHEEAWQPRFAARRSMPVFMSHGTEDEILPFALSERLRDAMRADGMQVTFVPFADGHDIPVEVVDKLREFLKECFQRS